MSPIVEYLSALPTVRMKKGEVILFQGELPERAYGIKSGIVKVYNLTSSGEPHGISYETKGDIFPICWLFSRTEKSLYYYETHTDCEFYLIHKDDFSEELKNNPELSYAALEAQTKVYVSQTLRINALEQSRASTKLICMLHALCLRHGKTIAEHTVEIQIPLTQQELSESLGLTRETTAVELKALKNSGIILQNTKLYVVDTQKLNQELDDEYNPGIDISA